MISLKEYVIRNIFEGGLAGHMSHPFDNDDFTCSDLQDMVQNLFSGNIEHMKEKLDGMNMAATMNNDGEVVFIRNKKDLNSERGGMNIDDIKEKWQNAPHQVQVFSTAARIMSQIFPKLGAKYFNPSPDTRKIINCECLIAGKTNILLYDTDRVAFHGYSIYTKGVDKSGNIVWVKSEDVEGHVDEIYKAAEGIDEARPRPDLVIKSVEHASKSVEPFVKAIEKVFTDEGLGKDNTIDDLKKKRFIDRCPDFIKDNDKLLNIMIDRIVHNSKAYNMRDVKKEFKSIINVSALKDFEDNSSELMIEVMKPIDKIFLKIGNEFIGMLDGFANIPNHDKVISALKSDIIATIDKVKSGGDEKSMHEVERQLGRLKALGDQYNDTEGVVFTYKGRRMKLTGSFAPINRILGERMKFEK